MMGITGAFSSLCISERPGSLLETSSGGRKFSKNRSTISLPNMDLSDRPPISTPFIKTVCDDEIEQPIDFSKKYCETKSIPIDNKIMENGCTFSNVVKSYNNSFTIYAETDLDQPTDYSLRYAEDDSDSDRCNKIPKTELVEDTVKTYCTEDTPYETPFNFSTATSMSDLRLDDKPPDNKLDVPIHKNTVINPKGVTRDKIKSEFSSGLMSPEKPVNYCEEGTPGYFSRVPSCGSLNSIPATDPPKPENGKKELRRTETKVVKFEEVVNYAEETPLMFSRSSSLGSLDSIEQHSIHDDRSSVVSDFSRLTSGVISPSELPDSPSQTVPPSPRPRKTVNFFPLPGKKKTVQNVPKSSIFEDSVKKFKLESTPLHFSTATSLSSLVDDDVEKVSNNEVKSENNENLNDLSEEDEQLLAACISIGMQGHRYSQGKSKSPLKESSSFRYSELPETVNLGLSTVPVITFKAPEKNDVTSDSVRTYCTEGTPAALSHAGSNSDLSILSMHLNEKLAISEVLQSERSDLSITFDQTGQENASAVENQNENLNVASELELKDELRRSSISSLSESEEALLEKCILDGMAKSPSVQKTEEKTAPEVKKIKEMSSGEDEDILENCIKMGIENKRYNQPKLQLNSLDYKNRIIIPPNSSLNDAADDVVKSFCTEDTPAILSQAGSCSNLSILSLQGNENGSNNDYFSDNSTLSDEEEKLLAECIKLGMGVVEEELTSKKNRKSRGIRKSPKKRGNTAPAYSRVDAAPGSSLSDVSQPTDDLDSDEEALLQQCIRAGMPAPKPNPPDPSDLDSEEEALLQKCIEAGMGRHAPKPLIDESSDLSSGEEALLQSCIQAGMPKPPEESSDLSSGEEELLQQCIQAGMPKAPSKVGRDKTLTPTQKAVLQQCILDGMRKCRTANRKQSEEGQRQRTKSRVSRETELSESERLLLQQCILAGMPKSRSRGVMAREGGAKRGKEAEHTCCIHCPRNRAGRQQNVVKSRRRYRERGVQVRESRDVNVVYVASQILTVRKEVVDRTHEKWV